MIHKTYAPSALFTSAAAANAARLRSLAQSLEIEDTRTRAIFKANLRLLDAELDGRLVNEIPFDANAALACGLITDIRDFAPPASEKLFNL